MYSCIFTSKALDAGMVNTWDKKDRTCTKHAPFPLHTPLNTDRQPVTQCLAHVAYQASQDHGDICRRKCRVWAPSSRLVSTGARDKHISGNNHHWETWVRPKDQLTTATVLRSIGHCPGPDAVFLVLEGSTAIQPRFFYAVQTAQTAVLSPLSAPVCVICMFPPTLFP